MSEPQSETPEPFRIELIEANSKLARCERELTAEREAKLEYLRRDAERNRQLANLTAELEAWKCAREELEQLADIKTELASMEQERDESVKEAARRDQKWKDGIDAICGTKLSYDIPCFENRHAPSLDDFIRALRAELAALRATREQGHGAAIEAAAKECASDLGCRHGWHSDCIARFMRALASAVTNSQQKGGDEPCAPLQPSSSQPVTQKTAAVSDVSASNAAREESNPPADAATWTPQQTWIGGEGGDL